MDPSLGRTEGVKLADPQTWPTDGDVGILPWYRCPAWVGLLMSVAAVLAIGVVAFRGEAAPPPETVTGTVVEVVQQLAAGDPSGARVIEVVVATDDGGRVTAAVDDMAGSGLRSAELVDPAARVTIGRTGPGGPWELVAVDT
jgi:hypothetical protein